MMDRPLWVEARRVQFASRAMLAGDSFKSHQLALQGV
jgi:hypothetical protein